MIEAILRGKQDNMEDLLTSAVFGTLRHLDVRWIGMFLSLARGVSGERPLTNLQRAARIEELTFWPQMRAPSCAFCEPDVLLQLVDGDGRAVRILVEAKYRSGKSSIEDPEPRGDSEVKDQLAREWENL